MKFIIIISFTFFTSVLNAQLNIFDGFDKDEGNWPVASDKSVSMRIEDGMYHVQSASEGAWHYLNNASIIPDEPFRFESGVQIKNRGSENSAGIIWGYVNDSTYHYFGINGRNEFIILIMLKKRVFYYTKPSKHAAINDSGFNFLRVEYLPDSSEMRFFINEIKVGQCRDIMPATRNFGYYAEMAGNYAFDHFWLVQENQGYYPCAAIPADSSHSHLIFRNTSMPFEFSAPAGTRVDITAQKGLIWFPEMQLPAEGIRFSYTKTDLQDSFMLVARADFNYMIMHVDNISGVETAPIKTWKTANGDEVCELSAVFLQNGKKQYLKRFYVWNSSKSIFTVFETHQDNLTLFESLNTEARNIILSIKFK